MFRLTYQEILELVGRITRHTGVARAIVRKSGFRSGAGVSSEGIGTAILLIPAVRYAAGGTASTPF